MPLPDLTCSVAGVRFPNPIVLASGILGTSETLLLRAAEAGAGGVTTKSAGPQPRAGHPNPVAFDWGHGIINAIGLTNPGAREEAKMIATVKRALADLGVPVVASIFAGDVGAFGHVAAAIAEAQPDLIEVNISCPNVASEFGLPFAASADSAAAVTACVKANAHSVPISVKLAPNVPDIRQIAQAVVAAGANAITAINTMPGMIIDAEAGRPALTNRVGGVSGPALKPIALRCVAEIASVVDVPIIGTGGVTTGRDAAEMLMAGATLVGVGSAVWYRGPDALGQIVEELAGFLTSHGYGGLSDVRGLALR